MAPSTRRELDFDPFSVKPGRCLILKASPLEAIAAVPVSADQRWWAAGTYVESGENLILVELRVFPSPDGVEPDDRALLRRWKASSGSLASIRPGGISSRLLRSVSLDDLHESLLVQLDELRDVPDWKYHGPASVGRPGRGGRPEREWAEWAQRYVELMHAGSRRPIADLAQEHGLRETQVRDAIAESRRRGFLTRAGRGRAGGLLTEKARQLLGTTETERG